MVFDFHSRYGLFTYSQSGDLDPWEVSNHFTQLGAECIIGQEQHADGGVHLHAFVDWGKRRRFRNCHFADVHSVHPNIVPSRGTPGLGWDYATKDGDIVAGGLERPGGSDDNILRKDKIWHQIMDANSRDEFFELVRDLAPADLAKCFPSLCKYADWRYAPSPLLYDGPGRDDASFDISQHPELIGWVEGFDSRRNGQSG